MSYSTSSQKMRKVKVKQKSVVILTAANKFSEQGIRGDIFFRSACRHGGEEPFQSLGAKERVDFFGVALEPFNDVG